MRKVSALIICFGLFYSAQAQVITDSIAVIKPITPKYDMSNLNKTAADHFMIQLADNFLTGAPDSISRHLKSLNRSANVYLMLNKPFRGNDKLALGIGIGIGTSNLYFKKMNVDIAGTTPKLNFTKEDSTNHYKKYKFSTTYLEVPLELRFSSKPLEPGKSIKVALGIKGGILLNAKTKGKTLQDKSDKTINSLTEKISSSVYVNKNRFAATARVGYGIVSLFANYGLNGIFKSNVSADMKLVQVGITISGL